MTTEKQQAPNLARRRFLTAATGTLATIGAATLAVPFVSAWKPSERAQAAGAPVDVDVSALAEGQKLTVEWRGKPVWVVKRSTNMLETLPGLADQLRDPLSENSIQPAYTQNIHRSVKPEYLVVVGVCTHLGCAPLFKPDQKDPSMSADWLGGFFCPCHGSRFDLSGRVYQSVPAPTNLDIPPYHFVSDNLIRIGEDPKEQANG